MLLPKRVPWETLAELDELCSWVYGPQADAGSKLLAKNRLCAWQVNTPLPHALESVLSFLNAMLLESSNAPSAALRQAYALALIRFVNGLVDPLQQGVFARPIYSLAAQIGLPAWIVELRHRSTHEDLPSLEVLREATHESMSWLLNRYFLPTLSSSASNIESADLPPLDPLLANYKSLMKAGLKDASIQGRNKAEVDKLMKECAVWIVDVSALYAADSSVRGVDAATPFQKTKLATQRFCERLCDKGGLVPLSKSKRTQPGKNFGYPPNQAIWAPLVQYLDQQNEYLIDELLACMLAVLRDNGTSKSDPTFSATITSWVLWVVDTLGDELGACRRECVRSLLSDAGPEGENPIVPTLVDSLVAKDTAFAGLIVDLRTIAKSQRQVEPLLDELFTSLTINPLQTLWAADSMNSLEERHLKMKEALQSHPGHETVSGPTQETLVLDGTEQLPAGWSQIPQSCWVSCPIGAPVVS